MINNEIVRLIEPAINALGYELWACEYLPSGKHSVLRIYIDKSDGINVEDCARVSRQISALLDVAEAISGHYILEVSSPGLARPLFTIEQYEKYIGNNIAIKLKKPVNKQKKFTAVLSKVENDTITIAIDGTELTFPVTDIIKANLVV